MCAFLSELFLLGLNFADFCAIPRFEPSKSVIDSVSDQKEVGGHDRPSSRNEHKKQGECCAVKKKAKISVCVMF